MSPILQVFWHQSNMVWPFRRQARPDSATVVAKQEELFGSWSFNTSMGACHMPSGSTGPKEEQVSFDIAQPPVGVTWDSLEEAKASARRNRSFSTIFKNRSWSLTSLLEILGFRSHRESIDCFLKDSVVQINGEDEQQVSHLHRC